MHFSVVSFKKLFICFMQSAELLLNLLLCLLLFLCIVVVTLIISGVEYGLFSLVVSTA